MAAKKYVQALTQYLAGSGVVVGATSIVLTSLTDIYGNAISNISAFGDKGYITLEPDTTNEEAATFTSVTVNANGTVTLGGVSTVLAQSPYTETSGLVRQHSGGTKVVITDNVAFWASFANKNNQEMILGDWQVPSPATANSVVPRTYVDQGVLAGGADASTTVKGVTRLSVNPSVSLGNPTISIASPAVITLNSHGLTVNDSVTFSTNGSLPTGITAGTTYYVISAGLTTNAFEISGSIGGAAINTSGSQSGTHTLNQTTPIALSPQDTRVPTANQVLAAAGDDTSIAVGSGNKFVTQTGLQKRAETYATATGSANAYVLTLTPAPTALVAGQEFEFKANFANTGASTLNVNALGAIAIKKLDGATALASGDIANGQIVKVKYDGTNFQMLNPIANAPLYKNGTTTHDVSITGSQTIAHGLGVVPKYIRITTIINNGVTANNDIQSVGVYNGTTTSTVYKGTLISGSPTFSSGTNSSNIIYLPDSTNTNIANASVAFDATNITLTWAKTGSPTSTAQILWEAFA